MANNVEKRYVKADLEVRAEEGKPTVIEGYAAVFGDETVIGGAFAERVSRSAFEGANMSNTVALFNHDTNQPLARVGHGLELQVDERGLKYRFELGNQSYAQDLAENIRMGNVSTSSFGFTVKEDSWERREDGLNLRTIEQVDLLFDVSPTTQGAYPTTEVGLRSMELALENEGVLAVEEEEVRAYADEEEEEKMAEEEDEEEEEEEEARSAGGGEDDCGCGKNKDVDVASRDSEETLETADAPVAEESAKIIERGAESEISMKEEKNAPAVVQGLGDKVQNVRARFDLGKAIREAANGGLTGLEAEINQEGVNEFRGSGLAVANGISIPAMFLRADAVPLATEAVSDVSAVNGGTTIANEIQGPIADYKPVTIADKMGARKITGVTGDISIPVLTTAVTASKMTNEADPVDSTNAAFTDVTLSPERLAAHAKVTQQLLAQNSFDLQSFLAADIRRGLEVEYNKLIVAAIEGVTETDYSTESEEDVPYLLEEAMRQSDVDPSGAKFLTEPTVLRRMRRAALDAGSGMFAAPNANSIIGYETLTSTLFTDNNIYMVQPQEVVCCEWGGLNIMVDPYTEAHKDVVRIIANMYADAAILRNDAVKGGDIGS